MSNWPHQVNFLDESGVNINLALKYGRAMNGLRVRDSVPLNTPTNTTVIAAMSDHGVVAPSTWTGGTTKERFLNYLREDLGPALEPGDILVLDNLAAHRAKEVEEIMGEFGVTVLYLPPYSPDRNPIEMCWSKMKEILRKLRIRDPELLVTEVKDILTTQITPENCAAWFRADYGDDGQPQAAA